MGQVIYVLHDPPFHLASPNVRRVEVERETAKSYICADGKLYLKRGTHADKVFLDEAEAIKQARKIAETRLKWADEYLQKLRAFLEKTA